MIRKVCGPYQYRALIIVDQISRFTSTHLDKHFANLIISLLLKLERRRVLLRVENKREFA